MIIKLGLETFLWSSLMYFYNSSFPVSYKQDPVERRKREEGRSRKREKGQGETVRRGGGREGGR